jgi:hypothetical protein
MAQSKLDFPQIIKSVYDESAEALKVTGSSSSSEVIVANSLVPEEYDEVELTYVAPGNDGEGQIATAVYKLATVTVATLTLSYDSQDRLVGVVRS